MTYGTRPVLRYPGAKWRVADWIVAHLPPHDVYVEPFFGSGAVLFAKPPSPCETVNDLDDRIVNLFRVIRERPTDLAAAVAFTPYARAEFAASDDDAGDEVERARRFLVRVWMAHAGKIGSRAGWRWDRFGKIGVAMPDQWRGLPDRILAVADRLRHVHVEGRPALDVIAAFADPAVTIYADPPYLFDAWYERSTRYYRHEMTMDDHAALLDALVAHPGPVLLSGYRHPLYDGRLAGWRRVDRSTVAYRGAPRIESVWLNPAATRRQAQMRFAGMEAPA